MLAGIPVHVIQRGNNRQNCFFQDQDRAFYLFHLRRFLGKARCALHAYCLMTNHVHLLFTASSADGCGALMKHVGQLYTQYANKTYARSGSLWEGRFRSCLVQSEKYLLTCYRYIELNPVRAGLVSHPGEYSWSSYGSNVRGADDGLLTAHDEYLRLGSTPAERAERYKQLVGEAVDGCRIDEIRAATNGNFALGDQRFRREISAALGRRSERGLPGRPRASAVSANQLELLGPGK